MPRSANRLRRSYRTLRGYGTGVSYINVNRQIVDPKTGRWWEGANYEGPSDKTVAVLTFESLDGTPIAVYYNYAVHAVIAGQLDQVSGDIPGAASEYVEESFDDRVVALWSSGAAGDQNPIYFQQTYDLREIRIKDYAKRGVDISNAMPSGGEGLDRSNPAVARLMNQQRQMVSSMGQFLGEEVLRVIRNIERTETTVPLYGSFDQHSMSRPRADERRACRIRRARTKKRSPVEIRLGLLRVGDVMIGAVNAEVFTLDRAAAEAGVSVQSDDARHADEWNGPLRVYSRRCVVRQVHIRGPVIAAAARMCRIGHRQRDPGPHRRLSNTTH